MKIIERLKRAGNEPVGFVSSERGDTFLFGDQGKIETALAGATDDFEIAHADALLTHLDFGAYEEEPTIVEL